MFQTCNDPRQEGTSEPIHGYNNSKFSFKNNGKKIDSCLQTSILS